MRTFARFAFSIGATAGLLAGCGGSQPLGLPGATRDDSPSLTHHHTFQYTGAKQSFIVPAGVTRITVVALGASGSGLGGRSLYCSGDVCFGRGGRIYAEIPVKPREKLHVYVGGKGTPYAGGFNGGGDPGKAYTWPGNGGGGASDVREGGDALKDRVLVAAGGGGQGGLGEADWIWYYLSPGGNGGGEDGDNGGSPFGGGGGGGSQTEGGVGGAEGTGDGSGPPGQPGSNGGLAVGGNGGTGGKASGSGASGGAGGGGGGGYYGGGGGAGGGASIRYGSGAGGGGGGGSSWAERRAKHFRTWSGWKSAKGDGLVVFSWQ